jgi:uncharacterized protein YgiM (DUF1202 family)
MKTKGKFILMDIDEFSTYLNNLNIKRFRKITHIQTHHTWSPSYRNFNGSNHFEKMESMEIEHKKRKFKEIGQHFTTFPDGLLGTGRSLKDIPACIEGHNTGGICIENLGNFNQGGDEMQQKHKETIIKLNALLCIKFGLPVNLDTIVYHHWFRLGSGIRDNGLGDPGLKNHKTCPGTAFFGGNKIEHAELNFLPLIEIAIQKYLQKVPFEKLDKVMYIGRVTATLLNVRKGPSKSSAIVNQLKQDTKITVYEENGEWLRIGSDKWVSLSFIEKIEESKKLLTDTVLPEVLNIRNGPGISFDKVGQLSRGTSVTILDSKNEWDMIEEGKWVSANFLSKAGVSNPSIVKEGIVNASSLNIRNGPGINFMVVGQLIRGAKVEIFESINNWDRIGKEQWVFSDYIATL